MTSYAQSLVDHLTAQGLDLPSEDVVVTIESGAVTDYDSEDNQDFAISFTMKLALMNFPPTLHLHALIFHIVTWFGQHQPQRAADGEHVRFTVDELSAESSQVFFEIDMTDHVHVTAIGDDLSLATGKQPSATKLT